jgi:pantoate--beta-alanine ligase
VSDQGKAVAVVKTVVDLHRAVAHWRADGEQVALVPTMGALHTGHLSLVEAAKRRADRVVMSIFVNPTQFAPNEDFGAYPRRFAEDREKFGSVAGDLIFAPDVGDMYPDGFATTVSLAGPATVGLEDRFRPTHFAGVATVVAKLLLQAKADVALFGEKDYQQLKVIMRLARDLDIETKIVGVPTLREDDGLAMSSRNLYLSTEERAQAPQLHAVLQNCAAALRDGADVKAEQAKAHAALEAAGFRVDYIEARHAETLAPVETLADGPIRLLVAARLGTTRLIDNIAV